MHDLFRKLETTGSVTPLDIHTVVETNKRPQSPLPPYKKDDTTPSMEEDEITLLGENDGSELHHRDGDTSTSVEEDEDEDNGSMMVVDEDRVSPAEDGT